MSATETPDPDVANHIVPHQDSIKGDLTRDVNEIELGQSTVDEDGIKDHADYDKIDKELAQYAGSTAISISPSESTRLRRLIDRRVLVVMITTYFLQAVDKGTLSFSSIMNLPEDTGLVGQQYNWLTTCIYITVLIVEYPQVSSAPQRRE